MQWWCAARDVSWSWTWQPYPGVWLFVLAIAASFAFLRRHRRRAGRETMPARNAALVSGLLLVWIALDWPVGALGAGYLASLHMLQFLVLALIAPPLLLLAIEPSDLASFRQPPALRPLLGALTHPLTALLLFSAALIATHLPVVTDRLMPSQLGAFAIDTVWLGTGTLFWWPIIMPVPARPGFSPPVKMAYLFASMVVMTAPGAMITFSELPIYATFELAPPIPGISPIDDQRIAGIGMRLGGALVAWIAITVLFIRWTRAEERLLREERPTG